VRHGPSTSGGVAERPPQPAVSRTASEARVAMGLMAVKPSDTSEVRRSRDHLHRIGRPAEGGVRRRRPEWGSLLVNGVDVAPYVEAELNRRFPGRAEQRAADLRACGKPGPPSNAPGLRPGRGSRRCRTARWTSRWTASGRSRRRCDTWCWPPTCGSAAGCWSSNSLSTPSACSTRAPLPTVRRRRAPRRRRRRSPTSSRPGPTGSRWSATSWRPVTPEELASARKNPHEPAYPETTLSCLHTILEEEWEHHRYAVRDLDAIGSRSSA
jgi:hypothetical protein